MNPPRRTSQDGAKYREQYLSNLKLQASNDLKNLNANLILKKTGQTPNQLSDYRTTTEKMADVEGMKIEVRSFLASSGICSTSNANEVVQELTPAELNFAIQYKSFISTDFKGRGIPTQVFVAYLRKLIRKTAETQGVDYGLQQATGEAILMSNNQILGGLINQEDLAQLHRILGGLGHGFERDIDAIARQIDELRRVIPTARDMQAIQQLPDAIRADIQQLLNGALEDLPSKADFYDSLRRLEVAIELGDNKLAGSILEGIHDLIGVNDATMEQIKEAKDEVLRAIQEGEGGGGGGEAPAATPTLSSVGEDFNPTTWEAETRLTPKRQFLIRKKNAGQIQGETNAAINAKKGAALDAVFRKWWQTYGASGGGASGHGLSGKGLKVSRPKQKQNRGYKEKLDKPFEKPKSYTPFGRYVINKPKLNESIVMVRRLCGGALKELPTHSVSQKIADTLKTIVGGSIPEFDHIAGLGAKDQAHLHKILKLAKFDNVSVPNPQKSEEQKEMDRFDILRGEIMAGNDNKTLVKEFKIMLMKFLHQGRIPRREAHEILTDLAVMGF